MSLTFGSLFAGIGGFDLGFERASMVCKWQVEIDGYCQRVLAKHWPNVRRWDDVRTWPQPDTERVDVICGGFPCQDISYAGRGAGLEGERSGLFFEAVRVVQQLRPRIVVLENVAALLTRGLDRVLGTLAEIGYDAEWHCIPAAAVGAPHIRDRVFIFADANDTTGQRFGQYGGQILSEQKTIRSFGSGSNVSNSKSIGLGTRRKRRTSGVGAGEENSAGVADSDKPRLEKRKGKRSNARTQQPAIERSSWWATEPDVGRVAHGVPSRVDRLRGLGNAVVPQVAEWIGRRIVEAEG